MFEVLRFFAILENFDLNAVFFSQVRSASGDFIRLHRKQGNMHLPLIDFLMGFRVMAAVSAVHILESMAVMPGISFAMPQPESDRLGSKIRARQPPGAVRGFVERNSAYSDG